MNNLFKSALTLGAAATLAACGGGGSASNTPANTTFSQSYTASAAIGELLNYKIDTNALTYSYTIVKSSYGCEVISAECHSASGSLVKNNDGTFSPSTSLASKIYALENGMITGSIALKLNGVVQQVPILGVAKPATTAAEIAGTYNYISYRCPTPKSGTNVGCTTSYGTVTIKSTGTFDTCNTGDITAATPVCTGTTSGTATYTSDGVWSLQATLRNESPTIGSTTNFGVIFTAPNGQKVGFIDNNDATVFGYGQTIVSSRVAINAADIAGKYITTNLLGESHVTILDSNGQPTDAAGVKGSSVNPNTPWAGIGSTSTGGYGMIAGNGVTVYMNPIFPDKFELGLKVN